jgi:G2/mitotic-specific cyclin 2
MPNPAYMKSQVSLEWRMRGILVDWLIEVHAKFRLLPETLFLCVNLVDRFLSARHVGVEKLQLVGITALLVASKYEEVMAPAIEAFIYVADGGYTEDEILRAERYLLHIIGFDLSYQNPLHFVRRISKADDYDIHTRTIAKYLIEISLVDDRFLKYAPSIVAAAGMFLSRQMMDRGLWVHPTHLSITDFIEC